MPVEGGASISFAPPTTSPSEGGASISFAPPTTSPSDSPPKRAGPGSLTRQRTNLVKTAVGASVNVLRAAALAAVGADVNGDGRLDWDEFQDLLQRITADEDSLACNEASIRELFNAVDADGSGSIAIHEFFLWALQHATQQGCGLQAIFQKYDLDGEGKLDIREFGLAVEDLGFPSSLAAEVFIELDEDGGGSVTCAEMMSALHARSFAVSSDTKAFLADLAFVDTAASVGSKERYAKVAASLFAGTNRINAIDADTLRSQLQSRILAAGVRASDLYVVMLDGKPHLTLDVFTKAIMRFGYAGPLELIPAIFGQVETDGSDVIGISELHAWINAPSSTVFTDRLNAARKCSIKDCRVDGLVGLHAILGGEACTAEVLQTELQTMLVRLDVTPLDLVRAWDKNGDGQLSFKEFLVMIKRLVHPEGINELDLWDLDLRSLVQTIFDQIAGADKTIDLIEVQRWLERQ